MKFSRTLVVLLVVLVAIPSPAMAGIVGEPNLQGYAPSNKLVPGQETSLDVVVTNYGGDTEYRKFSSSESSASLSDQQRNKLEAKVRSARNVRLTLEDGEAPLEVNTATLPVGDIPHATQRDATFSVSVNENATPGTYEMTMVAEYEYDESVRDNGDVKNEEETTTKIPVTVVIEEAPRFEVVSVNTTAQVGGSGTTTVTMRNVGSQTAFDSSVSLTSQNAEVTFGQASTASRYAGEWAVNETRSLEFETGVAPSAAVQQYSLSAVVNYENEEGIPKKSKNLATGVTPLAEQSFSLEATDSTLRVGRETTVSGTITNDGPQTASDAVVVVSSKSPNTNIKETEYALGTLEAGESSDFSFSIEVTDSADAGQRQLSYTVEYRNVDGDTQRSDALLMNAEVKPKQDLFDVSVKNGSLEAGNSETVTLVVTNNGDETFRNIDAKAFADSPLSLTDETAFIEELGPGDSTEITLGLSASSSANPKTYSFDIDFEYENEDGERKLSDSYPVAMTVTESTRGGGLSMPLVGGLVVVGLGVVGFLWYRR
ncbi:COG1361 S-layer family protein [Haloferax larsenii]|uniref:COG1361 S-layer family protein n=1 Tax=Haloferax larsenii TaxID=302484 RepID=A0ABY5REV1_HALLR|nr:COG1361 S-layer family protein [Haloferax larsenii]ELZ78615.1 sialidase-1 [Haloferax larsenii JCM 13917]UVE50115.1 COG1361 S-layer family protein [Haloferax larsenii]